MTKRKLSKKHKKITKRVKGLKILKGGVVTIGDFRRLTYVDALTAKDVFFKFLENSQVKLFANPASSTSGFIFRLRSTTPPELYTGYTSWRPQWMDEERHIGVFVQELILKVCLVQTTQLEAYVDTRLVEETPFDKFWTNMDWGNVNGTVKIAVRYGQFAREGRLQIQAVKRTLSYLNPICPVPVYMSTSSTKILDKLLSKVDASDRNTATLLTDMLTFMRIGNNASKFKVGIFAMEIANNCQPLYNFVENITESDEVDKRTYINMARFELIMLAIEADMVLGDMTTSNILIDMSYPDYFDGYLGMVKVIDFAYAIEKNPSEDNAVSQVRDYTEQFDEIKGLWEDRLENPENIIEILEVIASMGRADDYHTGHEMYLWIITDIDESDCAQIINFYDDREKSRAALTENIHAVDAGITLPAVAETFNAYIYDVFSAGYTQARNELNERSRVAMLDEPVLAGGARPGPGDKPKLMEAIYNVCKTIYYGVVTVEQLVAATLLIRRQQTKIPQTIRPIYPEAPYQRLITAVFSRKRKSKKRSKK